MEEVKQLNVYQRILEVMRDLSYIQKGKKEVAVGSQGYRFVSHDQVTAAVHPLLVKHGIVVIPTVDEVTQETNRTRVTLSVAFVNVDSPQDHVIVKYQGYGIDGSDKGPGKAISYAYKYALLKTFCLETGDDPDKDQESKLETEKCAEFDDIIPQEYTAKDMKKMKLFLEDRAKVLDKHVEDIKREAVKRPVEFLAAVAKWKKES